MTRDVEVDSEVYDWHTMLHLQLYFQGHTGVGLLMKLFLFIMGTNFTKNISDAFLLTVSVLLVTTLSLISYAWTYTSVSVG